MRVMKLGDLTARVAGGTDREGGGDGPVLVLLHGFGAPGVDLVPLFRALDVPREVRFVFPAAPLVLEPRAPEDQTPRAWWLIDIAALQARIASGTAVELARETPPGLEPARAAMNTLLLAIETELNAPIERVVLGGFSQGAMLACDVGLRAERPPAGLVLLSGAPISVPQWKALAPRRAGLPVLMSHGRSDPILPFAGGLFLRDLLTEAKLRVEWLEWNGGHGIPDSVVSRLGPFVTEASTPRD